VVAIASLRQKNHVNTPFSFSSAAQWHVCDRSHGTRAGDAPYQAMEGETFRHKQGELK